MFLNLKSLSSHFKVKTVRIYDTVFILHSKVTVVFLLSCCALLSAKQYFGEPIRCISDEKNKEFVETFCWIFGTYIYAYLNGTIGQDVIMYGVNGGNKLRQERVYQRYYQWVSLILVLQALFFYLPAYLWKVWEGGRLQQLCNELGSVLVTEEWNKKRKESLLNYFTSNWRDTHVCYALRYFFCELLNFFITALNLVLMNTFFSGFWINFAPALKAIPLNDWDSWNRMSTKVFPKMAKCEFFKYGSSGSAQTYDVLCLLPLNILNEKLFAFLWFWFIILTLISSINIIFRLYTVCSRRFRIQMLRSQIRALSAIKVQKLTNDGHIGDWFLLYKMCLNINPIMFRELMDQILERRKLNDLDLSMIS